MDVYPRTLIAGDTWPSTWADSGQTYAMGCDNKQPVRVRSYENERACVLLLCFIICVLFLNIGVVSGANFGWLLTLRVCLDE